MLATGGLVDTGKPVAMPQGHKKPSAPVAINQLSGTFKKGGRVKHYNQGALVAPASKSATVVRERITTTAPTDAERQRMRQQVEEQRASEAENKGYERFKREILPSQMGTILPGKKKGGKAC